MCRPWACFWVSSAASPSSTCSSGTTDEAQNPGWTRVKASIRFSFSHPPCATWRPHPPCMLVSEFLHWLCLAKEAWVVKTWGEEEVGHDWWCFSSPRPSRFDFPALNMTSASSFQMLRGAVIIFTGLLSVAFLGRRLAASQWLGILTTILGLVVVGLADFVSGNHGSNKLSDVITGGAPRACAHLHVR